MAKNSVHMWDGPFPQPHCLNSEGIHTCLGWPFFWIKAKVPKQRSRHLFPGSAFPRKCNGSSKPFGNFLDRSVAWLVWVFRERWETILLEGFLQPHSCQPWESSSGSGSCWNCSCRPLSMQWSNTPQTQPWEASPVSSALPGRCERRHWLQWFRWGVVYRWIGGVGVGVGAGFAKIRLCGLQPARPWSPPNPGAWGREVVLPPRSFRVFVFLLIHLQFELVIHAHGNKTRKVQKDT